MARIWHDGAGDTRACSMSRDKSAASRPASATAAPWAWWDPPQPLPGHYGARTIAGVFASVSRLSTHPPTATRDSNFDPAGEELASHLPPGHAGPRRGSDGGLRLGHQRPRRHPRHPPNERRTPRPLCGCGHDAPTGPPSGRGCSGRRSRSWPGWPTPTRVPRLCAVVLARRPAAVAGWVDLRTIRAPVTRTASLRGSTPALSGRAGGCPRQSRARAAAPSQYQAAPKWSPIGRGSCCCQPFPATARLP